jgi:phosphoribosyl 1,2-cyclic phosphate phosphodiesterase
VLIDPPPARRLKLIHAGADRLDAVLFTHEHADHTHGIDDIRAISVRRDGALPMYGSAETMAGLTRRFPYIFDEAMKPLPGTTKPEGFAHVMVPGTSVRVGHLDVLPVALPHGRTTVTDFRIGELGYITDAKSVPDEAIAAFRGVKVLVINALFWTSHPTHLSIGEAVEVATAVGAGKTYLTHLTHEMSHAELAAALPKRVSPAYDGLTVKVTT